MRAVKSIILAAGGLKRDYPDEDESRLVLRAISDCNIPKFITEDIPLFEGIISDLFPTTDKSKPDYDVLMKAIKTTAANKNLEDSEEFETKTIQLFETVQVRHGLMMVGAIMSAKTTIIHTLADALSLVNKQ
jgi:dynein heavy chain, axonemal